MDASKGHPAVRGAAIAAVLLAVVGCQGVMGGADGWVDDGSIGGEDGGVPPDGSAPEVDGDTPLGSDGGGGSVVEGWIGSPCGSNGDCDYGGGMCLTAAPEGSCSLPCGRLCPDQEGSIMTFCVAEEDQPAGVVPWPGGACFSRCDYGPYPETGCRPGYGCVSARREGELDVEHYVCLPGEGEPPTSCYEELAAEGVSFEPTVAEPESPPSRSDLTCLIADPVIVHPPIHGVDLVAANGAATRNILASCEMALALVRTVDDVAPFGVARIRHMGTYNCRLIAGTDELSRHAYGDAIDFYGFDFDDGRLWTVVDDWEHDTDSPVTEAGSWLYDTAYRWHDEGIWTIILTPNYNVDHDDHFHVDLTPGSDFITKDLRPGYIGPAPYAD